MRKQELKIMFMLISVTLRLVYVCCEYFKQVTQTTKEETHHSNKFIWFFFPFFCKNLNIC